MSNSERVNDSESIKETVHLYDDTVALAIPYGSDRVSSFSVTTFLDDTRFNFRLVDAIADSGFTFECSLYNGLIAARTRSITPAQGKPIKPELFDDDMIPEFSLSEAVKIDQGIKMVSSHFEHEGVVTPSALIRRGALEVLRIEYQYRVEIRDCNIELIFFRHGEDKHVFTFNMDDFDPQNQNELTQ